MTAPPDPLAEFRLDGDVAVVTGGASGIGRVVAAAFAAVGLYPNICFQATKGAVGGFLAQ